MSGTPAAGDRGPTPRCFGADDTLLGAYHDREWGRPVTDELGLYERICLEGFQAGLSWRIVLARRPALRAAFAGFDPEQVAGFADAEVERLMANPAIIRNRAKLQATITNARATLALRRGRVALPALVWSHRPPREPPAPVAWTAVPARTAESAALSAALRAADFRFVGPTTAYALMQACGLVNDHLNACPMREQTQRALRDITLPA